MPSMMFRRWKPPAALLALALLLGSCGRADQAAPQPSAAPPAPLLATPEAATATPGTRPTPLIFRPTPDALQQAATATAETIETNVAAFIYAGDATATAKAEWAQTPEPTIVPPAGGERLRDLWPASPQAASAPSRLYLRSPGYNEWKPDLFWEVHLSDLQLRRLPVVEQYSLGDTAQVSPDGRFLAYVTGSPPTLRFFDLASDTDTGVAVPSGNGRDRCHRSLFWSPDGRTLAALGVIGDGPKWTGQLLLFDPHTGPTPQTLLLLPGPLELLGWLDDERLLLVHWSRKVVEPARLLIVDRQGNQTFLRHIEPGIPRCSRLSPDGRDLIYEQANRTRRLQLASGQEQPFSTDPDTFFWAGDGRTLLVSRFNRERTIWLRPLEQPQQQQRLFLSPPYQSEYSFGITGVSPDGNLLVACERPPSDNPRIPSSDTRTWLYDIAQDRWTLIHTNPDWQCDLVVGWSTLEGRQ